MSEDAPQPATGAQPWESATLPEDAAAPLDAAQRTRLLLDLAQECVAPSELFGLMERAVGGQRIVAYDGFEPSGRMHIAQALLKVLNVRRLRRAGCDVKIWIADWYALMNGKFGGDLAKITDCGHYFVEVWRALGLTEADVEFVWASDAISKASLKYWPLAMDIAAHNSVSRLRRCSQIMGREAGDDQPAAQILYPCMQAADIFFLGAHICQLGMDQRKVNMLAREYAASPRAKAFGIRWKPVVLSHAMLPSLRGGDGKMSKSDPDSAIFCDDAPSEVSRKIKHAFCRPGDVDDNPVLGYATALVLPFEHHLLVERRPEHGGDVDFLDADSLRDAFRSESLHPDDLKKAVTAALNRILEPVRAHFRDNKEARALAEKVKRYRVTK